MDKKEKNKKVGEWVSKIMKHYKDKGGTIGGKHYSKKKAHEMAVAMAFSKVKRGEK